MNQESALEQFYLDEFRASQNRPRLSPDWVGPLREAAWQRFRDLGVPDKKHEAWRDFDLEVLRSVPFRYFRPEDQVTRVSLIDPGMGELEGTNLVFVNGIYSENLSKLGTLPDDVVAGHLTDPAWQDSTWLRGHLAQMIDHHDQSFTALNTAFVDDGAVIRIPAGCTLGGPLRITFMSVDLGPHQVVHPRLLVVAEAGSSVTILESHVGLGAGVYWTNSVTEVHVAADAHVNHIYEGRDPNDAIHFNAMHARVEQRGRLESVRLNLGGGLVRSDVDVALRGAEAEYSMAGLFFGQGVQHLDQRAWVRHDAPRTKSHQLVKGVLDDQASGAFAGRVLVGEGAQEIRAQQTSRNLLLSNEARAQAKPELEIYADDVRCTHASTTGRLDEEALFYLQTRGMDAETARRQLIMAFIEEVVNYVGWEPFRRAMVHKLEGQMMGKKEHGS